MMKQTAEMILKINSEVEVFCFVFLVCDELLYCDGKINVLLIM